MSIRLNTATAAWLAATTLAGSAVAKEPAGPPVAKPAIAAKQGAELPHRADIDTRRETPKRRGPQEERREAEIEQKDRDHDRD